MPEKKNTIASISPSENELSRQRFLQLMLAGTIALQFPWLSSCSSSDEETLPKNIEPLNTIQYKNLRALQNILFPDDGNGPSTAAIHAGLYACWVLNDKYFDHDINARFINGLNKLNTLSLQQYNSAFYSLSESNKEQLINSISAYKWGDQFLSRNITLIFEALLLDPVYGGNTNQIGWQWLNHTPGNPRPNSTNAYPYLLANNEI